MNSSPDNLVLAGRNPVREALERGDPPLERVLIQRDLPQRVTDQYRRLADAAGVPFQMVPQQKLVQLAGGATHQGVVAVGALAAYRDLDEILSEIAPTLDDVKERKPIVLALDEIEDPHNFGAILRSAVAAGVSAVVVPDRRMAPLSAVALKASAGTGLRIPLARVRNLADSLTAMKERGYWVAGLAGDGEDTIWSLDWDRAMVLVIGGEGSGLRPRVAGVCDHLVSIPMRGDAESLNASVATGVALFAAVRDR
ncbi:23S rRNA (guanosine(2251)-2'-O)-methyltransferase RlmB [soil metagenome]